MRLYKQLDFLEILPSKDKMVVDCGCGDGRVLKAFYDNDFKVLGIDMNESKIKEAQILMPNGHFICDDIRKIQLPDGFLIFQNILQFLDSKQEVHDLLTKYLSNSMYVSLFGEDDELNKSALTWTRGEVEELMKEIGGVVRFVETRGLGRNLKNEKRHSHTFEIFRIV